MNDSLPPLPLPLPIPLNGPVNHSSKPPPPAPPLPPPLASTSTAPNPLEGELPTVTTDLVPLSYLIDRLVTQSYSDFSTLLETLPSHPDQQRKQLLVDYVLHTRRQFLKLLVLTRWSAESERIRKSINIIGFLSNQNHLVDETVTRLKETGEGLKGARVRNYDLETSLTVLRKGNYEGLPSAIREAFEGQEKLGDEEVLETMRECEAVMRWRLKMGMEEIPKLMRDNYRIADGRVTFRLEGLWEASFVYSGTETQQETQREGGAEEEDPTTISAEDQSEWYLLGIKFLFTVQDERGGSWNPTPTGPLKQHLVDLCNAQLARRPFLPSPPPPIPPPPAPDSTEISSSESEAERLTELQAKYSSELKEVRAKRKRDQPLQRGYTFLQRLALSYQLESVYAQAVGMIRSDWNACGLRVEMNGERDQVKVKYWNDTEEPSRNKPKPSNPATASSPASPGGTIIFSVSPSNESAPTPTNSTATPSISSHLNERSTTTRRRKALESLLNRSQSRPSSSSATEPSTSTTTNSTPTTTDYPPTHLQITYLPSPASSFSAISITPDLFPSFDDDTTDSDRLKLEEILNRVTKRHARETIEAVAKELGVSRNDENGEKGARMVYPASSNPRTDEMEVETPREKEEEEEEVPFVFVPLVGPHALEIHVDPKSGRVELRSASSSTTGETAATTIADGEGGGEREARCRSASDRLNSLRFSSGEGNGDAWIKSLPEVIAKIRATTILDELSLLFTLLSLPTLRRLPLPPRELLKFGSLPSQSLSLGRPTFLFVPLNAHSKNEGLEGFYLSVVSVEEEGVRFALVGTRERNDEGSGNSWVEITEVGWIYKEGESGKGKEKEGTEERGTNFGSQVSAETLRKVWNYCVHRILLYRIEQQLHSRQISYRSSSCSSSTRSNRLEMDREPPPFLVLDTQGLIRLPRDERSTTNSKDGRLPLLLLRTAALRITLQIRLNPSFPLSSLPPPFPSLQSSDGADSTIKLPLNVFYNRSTRALVFLTENEVLGAVERILKAYAGMMKELQDGIGRLEKEKDSKGKGKIEGDG
ncbi:uncharacterized protein JCM6883_000839 [Sporobolomyces salmoneus]|uniref:uncharacterized protein n=1 Tax=Sporobolomyces salmoneus TaxID=183962 RepID=UPI00316FEC73